MMSSVIDDNEDGSLQESFLPSQELVSSNFGSSARAINIDSTKSLIVVDVAPQSIAWNHGVRKGFLLVKVNGKDAVEIGKEELEKRLTGAEFTFDNNISFVANTSCIGVELKMTVAAATAKIQQTYIVTYPPNEVYWTLWENGAWEVLQNGTPSYKNITNNAITNCINALCKNRIIKAMSYSQVSYYHLFNAAASYELGDVGAMEGILAYYFMERHWTTDFQSLVRYYVARDLVNQNAPTHSATMELLDIFYKDDDEEIEDLVQEIPLHLAHGAFHLNNESLRIQYFASSIGVDTSPPVVDELLPDYSLPVYASALDGVESGGNLALSQATSSPVILVICMFSYRTNGPYDHLMRQWIRWYQAYSQQFGLQECHVLTSSRDRYALGTFESTWKGGENLALRQTKMAILYDENGTIQDMIDDVLGGVTGAPTTILIRNRRILHCSNYKELTDASVLNALRLTQDVSESLVPSTLSSDEKDMAAAA